VVGVATDGVEPADALLALRLLPHALSPPVTRSSTNAIAARRLIPPIFDAGRYQKSNCRDYAETLGVHSTLDELTHKRSCQRIATALTSQQAILRAPPLKRRVLAADLPGDKGWKAWLSWIRGCADGTLAASRTEATAHREWGLVSAIRIGQSGLYSSRRFASRLSIAALRALTAGVRMPNSS
jgi:hypothetical protein